MCFEKFWKEYPSRKPHANPRKTAEKAYHRQTKNGYREEDLIEAAKNYASYAKAESVEGKYICMASTFLNQERFLDYKEPLKKPISMVDIL